MKTTNNGKNGGILKGKKHSECDDNGCGIKAVVTDQGNKPVELETDEVILERDAMSSKKKVPYKGGMYTPKEIASDINSVEGDGVAFAKPIKDSHKYEDGGVIVSHEKPSIIINEKNLEEFENGGGIDLIISRSSASNEHPVNEGVPKCIIKERFCKNGKFI